MKSLRMFEGSETERHLQRVEELTGTLVDRIASSTHYEWSETFKKKVKEASLMHDIGKATIPERILYKAGPLTMEERAIIETHPLTGEYLLKKFFSEDDEKLTIARNIILHHHERWDGTGYPHQKCGEDIPVEARIVALVDTYDALISQRCYKEPWTQEAALAHIKEERGGHFDPLIVDVFLSLFDDVDTQGNQ